jgi:hypothetical protein
MFAPNARRQGLLAILLVIAFFFSVSVAIAGKPTPPPPSLATQLQTLVTQGQTVDTTLAGINLTTSNSCTQLASANKSVADYRAGIETVSTGITAPLTLDTASLTSLDSLSNLAVSIGGRAKTLSLQVNSISSAADLFEYQASLAAMLRLSSDIGAMSDRILEMANKILLMADNIGLMADRILVTQQLQSANLALTQASILTTQQNMVALSSVVSTLGYNSSLSGLVGNGNLLSSNMNGVTLTPTNMGTELARIQTSVTTYLNSVTALYALMSMNSAGASFYINGDTLTLLGDLSGIHASLALALDNYAKAINQLTPLTAIPVLSSATDSMLTLTRDIGTMSDRILEMTDRIVVMADNIGTMSGRIVDTQTLQQSNFTLTQNSLLSASTVTVNVIKAAGL